MSDPGQLLTLKQISEQMRKMFMYVRRYYFPPDRTIDITISPTPAEQMARLVASDARYLRMKDLQRKQATRRRRRRRHV